MLFALWKSVKSLTYFQSAALSSQLRGFRISTPTMAETQRPTTIATSTQSLPKLSASDFKIYNSMADHMDLFVGNIVAYAGLRHLADLTIAQPFSANMEHTVRCCIDGKTP